MGNRGKGPDGQGTWGEGRAAWDGRHFWQPRRPTHLGLSRWVRVARVGSTMDTVPPLSSSSPTQRAAWIDARLAALYPETPVPLDHRSAYTLLIAVLLSAQCTDKRVNLQTPGLFARADTPAKMVTLSVAEIDAHVRPCGLAPRKAAAIRRLSELLLENHGGEVPRSFAELEALPGVGHKTASVVMSQAFGVPAFPVDTHIHRLAQRWRLTPLGANVIRTESDLKRLFSEAHWNALHLRIIFYGREYCTARGCDGTVCPLCRELFPDRRRAVRVKKA